MMMQGASKQWVVAGGAAFESECTAQTFIPVGLATDYCISTIIVIVTGNQSGDKVARTALYSFMIHKQVGGYMR